MVSAIEFSFKKLSSHLYNGFVKQNSVFIATPEKAMADALYFVSIGRYAIDFSAIDFSAFDLEVIKNILDFFPARTQKLWSAHASI
ncbi:MAG: hypothetical protein OMM_07021 [Candidatus Magnetoglobus multicellularis str. Araruama]|uniref:Uncharacterized protein n=1 Tax=Candidatus Magnetoglobus multicellularis str. Araruama TaxID=890399 RepID=A0A1V1PF55_9BACT|nr:MAG: hypothetical protein OMM_07021 [Candidatus Magnetoglobus multicellularis str. Araruama]